MPESDLSESASTPNADVLKIVWFYKNYLQDLANVLWDEMSHDDPHEKLDIDDSNSNGLVLRI